MGRTSTRNFLTLFRSVSVDDAERGPDVSQDIQLVYLAGDLRQTTYIYAGSGGQELGVVGEHAIVTIQCRVPRGMEIQVVNFLTGAAAPQVRLWTSDTQPVITTPANMITVMRTSGLEGLPAAPLSIAARGTIATGSIPTDTYRQIANQALTEPLFFINEGQHFNAALDVVNTSVDLGIRWRELRLFT